MWRVVYSYQKMSNQVYANPANKFWAMTGYNIWQLSGDQVIPPSGAQVVNYDTNILNQAPAGTFSMSAGTLTFLQPGIYSITAMLFIIPSGVTSTYDCLFQLGYSAPHSPSQALDQCLIVSNDLTPVLAPMIISLHHTGYFGANDTINIGVLNKDTTPSHDLTIQHAGIPASACTSLVVSRIY